MTTAGIHQSHCVDRVRHAVTERSAKSRLIPMSDLAEMPLDCLSLHCQLPLPAPQPRCEAAWSELHCRFLLGNAAAWDLWVRLLWPTLLGWIYVQQPDLSPRVAVEIAQRVLMQYNLAQRRNSQPLPPFTTAQLAASLQGQIRELLRREA